MDTITAVVMKLGYDVGFDSLEATSVIECIKTLSQLLPDESLINTAEERVYKNKKSLASLGYGMLNVPSSHIEMFWGLEVERPGLRESFLISGLKESVS
ncbi:hypothetical protein TNCV_351051 [Trichonephila clavipes]|nr:hypothetical protein TNCV_351051 [Trichonephila clavipes]